MELVIEFHDPTPESQDTSVGCSIHIGDFATLQYRGAANREGALAGAMNCLSMKAGFPPEQSIGSWVDRRQLTKLTHLVDHYGNQHPVTFRE